MVRQCVLGMLLFRDFVQKEKELEINKIYNENCLDTMARMPDGFVDLTVTSPLMTICELTTDIVLTLKM